MSACTCSDVLDQLGAALDEIRELTRQLLRMHWQYVPGGDR